MPSQHQQRIGLQLVKESPESLPSSALLDFKQHLGAILGQVERRKAQLDVLINLYEFYDSVCVQLGLQSQEDGRGLQLTI